MSAPVRLVHVLDDDPLVRVGLGRLLRAAEYEVVLFESPDEYLATPSPPGPFCLVLDLRMPGMTGFELLDALRPRGCSAGVVVLSGHGNVPTTVTAMRLGAIDFLEKPVDGDRLVGAVDAALARAREHWRARQEETEIAARFRRLTPREEQVCALVARGLLNKQIAAELGAAERTIKQHRASVMRKLRANSVADLVRLVDQHANAVK
jgi:FixJ family two-component response regulator